MKTIKQLETSEIKISKEGDLEVWEIPASANTKYLSHSYFRYIGQFPPQIARALISQYGKDGGKFLDPMCGGGTTLIEARLAKMNAIGFDINKVSVIWSKTRANSFEPILLDKHIENFIVSLNSLKTGKRDQHLQQKKLSSYKLKLGEDSKFFSKSTLNDLENTFSLLNSIHNKEIQNFILSAILSVIRQVSLANNKKMNVVIDTLAKKYEFIPTLIKKLSEMKEKNSQLYDKLDRKTKLDIKLGDARNLPLKDKAVDFVIIHPPYPTNTAFSESLRLQLSILGENYRKLHDKEIQIRGSYFHKPDGLRRYILDWNAVLKEIYRVLRPHSYCAIVIGDGKTDFVRIPMGIITTELAKDIGFTIKRFVKHMLVNNTGRTLNRRMTHDYIIVLKKD